MLTAKKKQAVIKKVHLHDKDTGSPEAQIGILSEQIESLAKHLKKHPKDNHSRRGLLKMISDRRAMLNYLSKKDAKRYDALAKKLELKKK
ncbi:MAG: 30S ribosomal protein S15 [Candidatus Paceibacterota bacterium]